MYFHPFLPNMWHFVKLVTHLFIFQEKGSSNPLPSLPFPSELASRLFNKNEIRKAKFWSFFKNVLFKKSRPNQKMLLKGCETLLQGGFGKKSSIDNRASAQKSTKFELFGFFEFLLGAYKLKINIWPYLIEQRYQINIGLLGIEVSAIFSGISNR